MTISSSRRTLLQEFTLLFGQWIINEREYKCIKAAPYNIWNIKIHFLSMNRILLFCGATAQIGPRPPRC
jgi:hypothetical protein